MNTVAAQLPSGFEKLEAFCEFWAIDGAFARARRRSESSDEERSAFYGVAKEMLIPAMTLLDKKRLEDLDGPERRLMNLMLSFAHVAQAVEIQRDNESKHAKLRSRLTITRASADSFDSVCTGLVEKLGS